MCIVREGWSEDGVTLPGALTNHWILDKCHLGSGPALRRCWSPLHTYTNIQPSQRPDFTQDVLQLQSRLGFKTWILSTHIAFLLLICHGSQTCRKRFSIEKSIINNPKCPRYVVLQSGDLICIKSQVYVLLDGCNLGWKIQRWRMESGMSRFQCSQCWRIQRSSRAPSVSTDGCMQHRAISSDQINSYRARPLRGYSWIEEILGLNEQKLGCCTPGHALTRQYTAGLNFSPSCVISQNQSFKGRPLPFHLGHSCNFCMHPKITVLATNQTRRS